MDGSGLERLINTEKLLVHDTACSDILVTYLAVAHDPVGQPNIASACVQLGAGALAGEAIGDWCCGELNSVEGGLFWIGVYPPAVADN